MYFHLMGFFHSTIIYFALIFFLFFWAGLRDPIVCSLLGGGILYQNSGYKSTRLCPSLCLGFFYYIVPPLLCFLPVICLVGLLVRPNPFRSTRPARSLIFLLSGRVLVLFHVRFLLRFQLRYFRCLCRPLLCPLQVYAGLFPPPPIHPRSRPPSGPLTEVQNWSRRNILRDRFLPPCDRLPYPPETCFP